MDSKIAFPLWAGYSIWSCSPRRSILGLSLFLNLKRLDCCGLNLRAHSLADFLLGFKERSEMISHNSCVLAEPKSLQDSSFCHLPLPSVMPACLGLASTFLRKFLALKLLDKGRKSKS